MPFSMAVSVATSQRLPDVTLRKGAGGKPVSPASDPGRHWGGRIHSGRLSCYFPTTPRSHSGEGGRGGNLFPPHLIPDQRRSALVLGDPGLEEVLLLCQVD